MDYPKFIVSNQKEESIRIQRVNKTDTEKRIKSSKTTKEKINIIPTCNKKVLNKLCVHTVVSLHTLLFYKSNLIRHTVSRRMDEVIPLDHLRHEMLRGIQCYGLIHKMWYCMPDQVKKKKKKKKKKVNIIIFVTSFWFYNLVLY